MNYEIEVFFDNKGSYKFEKEFYDISDLMDQLESWINDENEFVIMGNSSRPTIVNMNTVIAITTQPEDDYENVDVFMFDEATTNY